MNRTEYIKKLAPVIQKYCKIYGVKVASPIIAQAVLEGTYWNNQTNQSEESFRAEKYHNYFGMMAFDDWKGKKVLADTWEEFEPGIRTDTRSYFRAYDTMDEGIKGYFEFIKYPRYANLFETDDPYEYLRRIKADGYATASNYVDVLTTIIQTENLTQYDNFDHSEPTHDQPEDSMSGIEMAQFGRKCVFYDGIDTMFDSSLYGDYECAADILNVRTGAGTNNKIMISIFTGTKVMCNGFYREANGMKWLLIQFYGLDGTAYCGWASAGDGKESYFERI